MKPLKKNKGIISVTWEHLFRRKCPSAFGKITKDTEDKSNSTGQFGQFIGIMDIFVDLVGERAVTWLEANPHVTTCIET